MTQQLVEVPLTRRDAGRLVIDRTQPPYERYNPDTKQYWRDPTMFFLTSLVYLFEPSVAVEIGTFDGETTVALAWALGPKTPVYGLDLHTEWAEPLVKAWGFEDRVHLIRGDSRETIPGLPGSIGFAYIDGDHTAEGVKSDTELIWPKVMIGGIVAFHDTNGPGVAEYVRGRFPQGIQFPAHNGLTVVQKKS